MEGVAVWYVTSNAAAVTASTNEMIIEWEPQPSSPSSIRLISFGKLLDDKAPLSGQSTHIPLVEIRILIHGAESSLTHDAPNVIHMTVKPQEVVDEEDAKGGKSYSARDRETTDRSPGCRCVII